MDLEPIIPRRHAPAHEGVVAHGFELRLPNGPLVESDDPLLTAFGALVTELEEIDENDEMIQTEGLDPGRPLHLILEPGEDAEDVVAVWDAEQLHRAGTLPSEIADMVRAGLQHGLPYRALSLQEMRTVPEGRRSSLDVFVYPQTLVQISQPAPDAYSRPKSRERVRVVLLADGSSPVRWWDSAAHAGPAEIDEIPISQELVDELTQLDKALRKTRKKLERHPDGYRRYVLVETMAQTEAWARALWSRARAELARDYDVGFLGRGMDHPAWHPREFRRRRRRAEGVDGFCPPVEETEDDY